MSLIAQLFRSQRAAFLAVCASLALGACKGPLDASTPAAAQRGVAARQSCAEQALRNDSRAALLPEAAVRLSEQCQQGDAIQCSVLGVMLELGRSVPRDPFRAAGAFAAACRLGNARGCMNLGGLYASGTGLSMSAPQAAELFHLACQRGDSEGCYRLARMAELGSGLGPDPARAAAFLETSCSAGHAVACLELGAMNERGAGIPPNRSRAALLYERACHAGRMAGCSELDRMYSESSDRAAGIRPVRAPAPLNRHKEDGAASL